MFSMMSGSNGGGGTPASPPPVDLTQGLVAHYLLNNNADDIAGTYDGTSSGGVNFQGDMAYFDGVDDYIDCGEVTIDETSLTISYWARAYENVAFPLVALALSRTSGTKDMMMFGYRNNQVYVGNGSIWVGTTNYTQYTDGSLHHYTHTIDGLTLKSYVDGVLGATTTLSGLAAISKNMYICAGFNGFYNASISNIRLYSGVKDQTFIDALYAEGYYPKPLPLPTTDGLIAHYPLTGTAEDAWGEGGNESGTEYNGVSFLADYFGGTMATLNGSDNKLTTTLPSLSTTLSIAYVFKVDRSESVEGITIGRVNGGIARYGIMLNYGTSSIFINDGTSSYAHAPLNTDGTAVGVGDMVHLAIAIRPTEYDVYVNGEYQITITLPNPVNFEDNSLVIGYGLWSAGGYKDINVGDFRIYNGKSLTAQEVSDIYNKSGEPTGLTSHYEFNNNLNDSVGTSHLTLSGTAITYPIIGVRGDSVASFDGVDDYIDTNYQLTSSTSNTRTFGLWFYIDSTNGDSLGIGAGKRYYTDASGFEFGISLTAFWIIRCQYNDITYTNLGSVGQIDNAWNHVLYTLENGYITSVFFNGVELTLPAMTLMVPSTITTKLQGKILANSVSTTVDTWIKSKLSDWVVYDRILTAQEKLDIYNGISIPGNGLVQHMPLTKEWRALDQWVSYNGTENGGLTYVDDAEFGSTPSSTSTSTYLTVSSPFTMTGNWTASFWMYHTGGGGSLTKELIGGAISIRIPQISSTKYGFTHSGVADYKFTAGPDVVYNTWMHITYRKISSTQLELFLNGTYSSVITISDSSFSIARMLGNNDPAAYYIGYMRHVRGYNRALTTQEITDIYNYEKNFRPIDIDDGLISYHPLTNNSLDNYKNQYDITGVNITHNGLSAVHGANSTLRLGQNIIPRINTTSYCVWAKADGINTLNLFFHGWRYSSTASYRSGHRIYISSANGAIVFNTEEYTNSTYTLNTDTLFNAVVGEWCHIACTFDGTGKRIYVNGNLIASQSATVSWSDLGDHDDAIGGTYLPQQSNYVYNQGGETALARIYQKTINADQVKTIYNTEKSNFGL